MPCDKMSQSGVLCLSWKLTGGPPDTVRLAHDFVTEGSGQAYFAKATKAKDARATDGAGILPAASSFIPAALTKLTVLGGPPVPPLR